MILGINAIDIRNLMTLFSFFKCDLYRPLGYERVYLSLCKLADTPFHIQGDKLHVIK